jgi:hypothetical protein
MFVLYHQCQVLHDINLGISSKVRRLWVTIGNKYNNNDKENEKG